jgi:adenylate cyclase
MRPEDLQTLQAAGLYDPASPNAAERLALIEWLVAQGTGAEQIVAAVRTGSTLTGLAGDLARGSETRWTLAEVAEQSDLSPAQCEQLRVAVGLPPVEAERLFGPDDIAAFSSFGRASQIFGEQEVLAFMRVVGNALARIAEGAVSLFLTSVERPILESNAGEVALAQANLTVMRAFDMIPPVMASLLRSHLEVAVRRMRDARLERSANLVGMAVGFVDLVGFTGLSRQLDADALSRLVGRFEEVASDVVTRKDGRLVKVIGDEVMFVARDAAAACDIALTLVERFTGDGAVTPRGGLAAGALLARGGDYYGPTVNLASRVADLAVPEEVLVTEEVATEAAGAALRFEAAGKRLLKGFDEPVKLFAVARAVKA